MKKLGEGAFGAVYLVKNKEGEENALKVEAENDPLGLLKMEVYVLMELKKTKFQGDQELRNEAPMKKFSMGTAISVAKQCLEALEDLHNVYMLDFGMARKFVKEDGTLRNPRARAGFRGTVKYAPLACHVHREQCRKDDIESWMYMLVEITCGRLPWRNLTKDCKGERYRCLFGGCPREYLEIFPILDKGKFFDAPDYPAIYKLLESALQSTRAQEFPYDWEM
ncbi:unnamed protein product [Nippostrongylus brasiliensis]|uniref:Protein kinase domain-containing protein n=1 Tax=Nippostrongylus brasiliensis TaxID=27835 RepID=A0A0N4YJU8_NIPBR|nr:unnamed protein product [Nippostrongylus brasiliensis]